MCKKVIIFSLVALMLFIGGTVFAQTMVTLDQAIGYSASGIESRLESGAKVMVLNFKSASENLSNYVLDEMETMLVSNGKLTAVDRENLEFLLRELRYVRSGDISDESARSIGRILGAQYVISGVIEDSSADYIIQFKTMPVEPAALQTLTRVGVLKDAQMTNLMSDAAPSQTRVGTSSQTTAGTSTFAAADTSTVTWADYSDLTGFGTAGLNRKLVLSAGGGAYGKFELSHTLVEGESDLSTGTGFGGSIFLNAELFSYVLVELSPYYQYRSFSGEGFSTDYNTISAIFSVFGQYPIPLTDRITLSPLLGIGYDMAFYVWYKDTNATRSDEYFVDMFDNLYLKPGVRVNYSLTENLRLDARLIWDFLLYNKGIADQTKGTNATVIQHAPSLFLGVNYVFFRM